MKLFWKLRKKYRRWKNPMGIRENLLVPKDMVVGIKEDNFEGGEPQEI